MNSRRTGRIRSSRNFPQPIAKKAAPKKPSLKAMNVDGICENNWGQGDARAAAPRRRIWYFLEDKLNVPDRQCSFLPMRFDRN